MEASSNLRRTLDCGLFLVSDPWIEQLLVPHLSSDPCYPYGYLDQIESILEKEKSIISHHQSLRPFERRSRRSDQPMLPARFPKKQLHDLTSLTG
jgi:hypothetical protein